MLELTASAKSAEFSSIALPFWSEVKCSETVEHIDEKLRSRLTAKSSFKHLPRILESAQIVMVDKLDATIVPDAALESLASKSCLLAAAVLLAEKSLLPAIKLDRSRFGSPRCCLPIGLRSVIEADARVLGGVAWQHSIVVPGLVIVGKVDRGCVVHVWVEEVVEVDRRAVACEVWQEQLVIDGERIEQLAEEGVDTIPCSHYLFRPSFESPNLA